MRTTKANGTNAAGYTHQVNYSKMFISGLLEGLRYHDYLRFCSLKSAKEYAAMQGRRIEPCAGNSAYILEDCTISRLE